MPIPMPSLKYRPAYRRAAVLGTALLLVAFFVPRRYIPSTSLALLEPLAHLLLFAIAGWLWTRAFPEQRRLIVACGIGLALLTEAVQTLPAINRGAEAIDVALDLVGLTLGVTLGAIHARRATGTGIGA
jgi:VanZ family protein